MSHCLGACSLYLHFIVAKYVSSWQWKMTLVMTGELRLFCVMSEEFHDRGTPLFNIQTQNDAVKQNFDSSLIHG